MSKQERPFLADPRNKHREDTPSAVGGAPVTRRDLLRGMLGGARPADSDNVGSGVRRPMPEGGARTINSSLTRRSFLRTMGLVGAFILGGSQVYNRLFAPYRGDGAPTRYNYPEGAVDALDLVLADNLQYSEETFNNYLQLAKLQDPTQYDIDRLHMFNEVVFDVYGGDDNGIEQLQQTLVNVYGDSELPAEYQRRLAPDPYRDDGKCPDNLSFFRGWLIPRAVEDNTCYDLITAAAYNPDPAVLRRVIDTRDQYLNALENKKNTERVTNHVAIDRFAEDLMHKGASPAQAKILAETMKRYSENS